MPIDAYGGLDRLMPEVLLDDGQRHASLDHPRGTRMPQVVHTRRLHQAGFHRTLTCWLPAAVEELLCTNRIAGAVGEQEAWRCEVDDL